MFINGQKVACIDDVFSTEIKKFYAALPVKGLVYVVRGMAPGIASNRDPEICVYLIGLQNPCSDKPPYPERGFRGDRFRPLQEMTTEEIMALGVPEDEALEFVGSEYEEAA